MTDYIDSVFNTSGVLPTKDKFWQQSIDTFVTENGITPAFKKVLGEQVFRPNQAPQTPFYNVFAGRPLKSGTGFTERALCKNTAVKFNPKASASDDLQYYESEGIEKSYTIDVEGRISVSLPSELVSIEEFIKADEGVPRLNAMLVENIRNDYYRALESEIEKKVMSVCATEIEQATTDLTTVYKKICDIASDMRSDEVHYNELTATENGKIYTASEKVLCFIQEKMYNQMMSARADLRNPNELIKNVEFITMPNKFATPLTTAELTAGRTTYGWDDTISPAGLNDKQPYAFICSSKKVEYRPVVGGYKINIKPNDAGDFVNEHLIYRGCIAVRPWENAVKLVLPDS